MPDGPTFAGPSRPHWFIRPIQFSGPNSPEVSSGSHDLSQSLRANEIQRLRLEDTTGHSITDIDRYFRGKELLVLYAGSEQGAGESTCERMPRTHAELAGISESEGITSGSTRDLIIPDYHG